MKETFGHMKASSVATVIRRNRRSEVRVFRARIIRILNWHAFDGERRRTFLAELALFGLLAALSAWPICFALAALRTL
jgi:hypothetical protein